VSPNQREKAGDQTQTSRGKKNKKEEGRRIFCRSARRKSTGRKYNFKSAVLMHFHLAADIQRIFLGSNWFELVRIGSNCCGFFALSTRMEGGGTPLELAGEDAYATVREDGHPIPTVFLPPTHPGKRPFSRTAVPNQCFQGFRAFFEAVPVRLAVVPVRVDMRYEEDEGSTKGTGHPPSR